LILDISNIVEASQVSLIAFQKVATSEIDRYRFFLRDDFDPVQTSHVDFGYRSGITSPG
jgi:hypothetical protein